MASVPFLESRGDLSSSSHFSLGAEEDGRLPSPGWSAGLGSALIDAIHALEHTRPRTQTYSDSFVPNPKLTFLLERPRLNCQICHHPAEMTDVLEDSTPLVLFCGHVACRLCMHQWLAENDACPFCREDLTHSKCGHLVEPRAVTKQNVISIPRTKPAGGKVADNCRRCDIKAARGKARARLTMLVERYVRVRDTADNGDSGVARDELAKAQARLERFKQDFDYDRVMRDSAW